MNKAVSENGGKSGGCPFWLKALLVVSLVANMVVAGLYVGQMSKPKRERGADRQINWILKFVPEARREEAEKLFDSKREQIRELYRDRSKNMEEIVAAIRAEPFAPETLIAAMRTRRENSSARRLIIEGDAGRASLGLHRRGARLLRRRDGRARPEMAGAARPVGPTAPCTSPNGLPRRRARK